MAVVVPVGIHGLTGVDGEDRCACLQRYFSEPSRSAAHFENFVSGKVPGPISLAKKTLFRKLHAINRIKLSFGVFVPFKTEGGSSIVGRYKSRHKSSNWEPMLSSATNQKTFFDPISFSFLDTFYR